MSVTVTLPNNRAFTRETVVLLGGGALAGLVTSGLSVIAQSNAPELSVLSFAAIIGLLANLSDVKSGTPILRLVLAILARVVWAITMPIHWALGAGLGGLFIGLAFSLTDGDSKLERGFFVATYALALIGAVFTTGILTNSLFEVSFVANIFTGAVWGTFLAFAAGLKRVVWDRDEVLSEYKEAYSDLAGQERESMHAGKALYEQILTELKRVDSNMKDRAASIAEETSRALIALARRSGELRKAAERTSHRNLEQRVVELDERIEKTSDKTVAKELKASLDELLEQLRARRRFDVARARLDARIQRCFTALERLHVSLVQAGTGADDSAIEASVESLEKLADEVRWRNLSVDELVGDEESLNDESSEVDELLAELRDGKTEAAVSGAESGRATATGTVLDIAASSDQVAEAEIGGTDGTVSERQTHESVHQS